MGVQSVVLEHHGDIPVLGCHIVHQLAVDIQFAAADLLQAGDHPQGSGLAAAGGTYQHDELLVRNVQAELLHCQHALIRNLEVRLLLLRALFLLGGFLVGIDLLDVFQNNFCHDIRLWKQRLRSCSLTAGRGRSASVAGLHTVCALHCAAGAYCERQGLMGGRDCAVRTGRAVGKVQPCAAVRHHLQDGRIGAVVAAVAGCAAHHRPGSDGLDLFCRNTVPLAVVAHLEEVGLQGGGGQPSIAHVVGVAGE